MRQFYLDAAQHIAYNNGAHFEEILQNGGFSYAFRISFSKLQVFP